MQGNCKRKKQNFHFPETWPRDHVGFKETLWYNLAGKIDSLICLTIINICTEIELLKPKTTSCVTLHRKVAVGYGAVSSSSQLSPPAVYANDDEETMKGGLKIQSEP